MTVRDPKSIIVITIYFFLNAIIIGVSVQLFQKTEKTSSVPKKIIPEFTEIEDLEYFVLKRELPLMSLSAVKMRSQGDEFSEFEMPRGVYNYQEKARTIKYSADKGSYQKKKEILALNGTVSILTDEASYLADKIKYFFKKDVITGQGDVRFEGDDPQSKDHLIINADSMRGKPQQQWMKFTGNVNGRLERKKKYEGKMIFSSASMDLDGQTSLAQLTGDVLMVRDNYKITAGKADIYLENYNKSLKYFVLNDDVKVTEKLQAQEGVQERKAFSERLEGFGREQKMVLSGAPRVEVGKDVIKGYRITIRENVDLIEVDDAMSDVQVKRQKPKE